MRKLNQVRRAVIVACLGLVLVFGIGVFSAESAAQHPRSGAINPNHVAAFEAGTPQGQVLTRTGGIYDYAIQAFRSQIRRHVRWRATGKVSWTSAPRNSG